MIRQTILCALTALFSSILIWPDQLHAQILNDHAQQQARNSATKITISRDFGAYRYQSGSGFFWKDNYTIVTAYHLVSSLGEIIVSKHCGNQVYSRQAHLSKINRDADIAILEIDQKIPCAVPAIKRKSPFSKGEYLWVIGYPKDSKELRSLRGRVSEISAKSLDGLLKDKQKQCIIKLGFPSLNQEMIHLEQGLAPGVSGGLMVDANGEAVGIANGGLEEGEIGINWAIPISQIEQAQRIKTSLLQDSSEAKVCRFGFGELFTTQDGQNRSISFLAVQNQMARFEVGPQIHVRALLMMRTAIDIHPFTQKFSRNGHELSSLGPMGLIEAITGIKPDRIIYEGYLTGFRNGGAFTFKQSKSAGKEHTEVAIKNAQHAGVLATGTNINRKASFSFLIDVAAKQSTDALLVDMTDGLGAWLEIRSDFSNSVTLPAISYIQNQLLKGYGYFWLPAKRNKDSKGTPWPHVCMVFSPQTSRIETGFDSQTLVLRWSMSEWRGISQNGCSEDLSDIFREP